MKNYLISHISRRIEAFVKQAQENFNKTTYEQILALLAAHKEEDELQACMRNDTFRSLLSKLVVWSKSTELKKANIKVHLDIENFLTEMQDISNNPEIDETLADLLETDFYANFEQILFDIQDHAKEVGQLDVDSEEYQKMQQASGFDIFDAEENKFSNAVKRQSTGEGQPAGREVMGALQRCESDIEDTRAYIEDFKQTPELIKTGQTLLALLINEKLPLCKELEKVQNKLSEDGVDHFLRIENLDPDSIKRKVEPNNSGTNLLNNLINKKMPVEDAIENANKPRNIDPEATKRLKQNPDGSFSKRAPKTSRIVNPVYAEKLFPLRKAISKITQKAMWLLTVLHRDRARFYLESGKVSDYF